MSYPLLSSSPNSLVADFVYCPTFPKSFAFSLSSTEFQSYPDGGVAAWMQVAAGSLLFSISLGGIYLCESLVSALSSLQSAYNTDTSLEIRGSVARCVGCTRSRNFGSTFVDWFRTSFFRRRVSTSFASSTQADVRQ